jgi:hypothetical protein
MKPIFKTALISFCLNFVSCLLTLIHPAFLLLILLSLLVQIVIALDYIISGYDTTLDKGILIGIGLLGLLGFAIFIYNYQGI